MDVTKANFFAVLKHFRSLLQQSEFVCFDEEMTGITMPEYPDSFTHDPDTSFHCKRQVAMTYNLIQVGLCLFEKDTSSGSPDAYIVRPFNFYVFPSADRAVPGRPITMEPDAIAFNRKNNMDFQRWVYDGVGYCTAEQEVQYRKLRMELYENAKRAGGNIVLTAPGDISIAEQSIQTISTWVNTEGSSAEQALPAADNWSVKKYVEYQILEVLNFAVTFVYRGKNWAVTKGRKSETEALDRVESAIADFIGFREVFKTLVECKKPIVGHNVLSDFLFLIASMEGTLPKDVPAFRQYMRESFPVVYDTKMLCRSWPEGETAVSYTGLQLLFEYFLEKNGQKLTDFTFPLGFERYAEVLKRKAEGQKRDVGALAHEAAYDALCTGYVFLNLKSRITPSDFADTCNIIAIFKNMYALDLANDRDIWHPKGSVIVLTFPTSMTFAEVQATVGTFKGKVDYFENGSCVLMLSPAQDVGPVLEHYGKHPMIEARELKQR
eukprot:PhF_6_TR21892/c0_g1_i1/m.31088/K01148/PARN, PNLDC1; poly(A)-specific ribonuclease